MRSPRFRDTNSVGSYKVLFLLATIAACFCPTVAFGQTVVNDNWTGGGVGALCAGTFSNGCWSNPANWSNGVPNNSSDGTTVYNVIIDSGGTDNAILDMNVTINSLVLGGTKGTAVSTLSSETNKTLDITGSLTVNKEGKLDFKEDALTVSGNTIVAGRLFDANGTFSFNTLTNSATISITGVKNFPAVFEAASIANTGTIDVGGDSTLNCAGIYTQTKGTTSLTGPASISAASFSVNGGTIHGSGTITADVNLTGSKMVPVRTHANSIFYNGFTVSGNFMGTNKSNLMEVFGVDYPLTTAFPEMSGMADVNGTLTVTMSNGYTTYVGQTSPVVVAQAGIIGTFTTLNLPTPPAGASWQINYNAVYNNYPAIVITVVAN
jgi:hypothetical protein